jgi:hypothetical protein
MESDTLNALRLRMLHTVASGATTMTGLATMAAISQPHAYNIATGRRAPSYAAAERITDALNRLDRLTLAPGAPPAPCVTMPSAQPRNRRQSGTDAKRAA